MLHIFVGTTGHTMETKGRLQNVMEMGTRTDKERDRENNVEAVVN